MNKVFFIFGVAGSSVSELHNYNTHKHHGQLFAVFCVVLGFFCISTTSDIVKKPLYSH